MKKTIPFFILLALSIASCTKKVVNRGIQFNFASTESYCGGAAPDEQMIKEMRTPKPMNRSIFVHQSPDRTDDGIELEFSNGSANKAGFTPGFYYVFVGKKLSNDELYKPDPTVMDPECNARWYNQAIGRFEITEDTKEVSDTLHFDCNPCLIPKP